MTLRPIEIDFNKRNFDKLFEWLKNNCNEFCNKYNNFYILNFLLKHVYFFKILFNFFKENNYFWETVINLKFNKINKKIKALSSKYNNVIKKKSRLIWMENMFNNFFFKYIKFSVIKEMDLIFLEQELNINIYLYNRLLNFNSELIYKISDGELNAILLVSFFIECINSDKPLILLLDDASVAFDRDNWIGLLSLLLKIFNENKNKKNKLIMLSHDSSFIRISSKFFSNNFTICKNNKISYKTIINEQGVIKISGNNFKNNTLFKNNFLLIHFFNKLINDSKQKEKSKDNIESMLHYSTDYSINDFVEKLSLSKKHKNKLIDKIKNEYKLDLENDFIFDLFKSIYNDKNNNLYLIDFFYLRFLIEKFVSFFNKNKEVYKIGTIRFIEESKLDDQIKDRLKIIYSFLPIFIHCDFFDAAYLLNFNNNEAIANLIYEVEEMLKEKNIS